MIHIIVDYERVDNDTIMSRTWHANLEIKKVKGYLSSSSCIRAVSTSYIIYGNLEINHFKAQTDSNPTAHVLNFEVFPSMGYWVNLKC